MFVNVIVNVTKNVLPKCQKYRIMSLADDCVLSSSKCIKTRFRPGSALDRAGGAGDAATEPLVRWGGDTPSPSPFVVFRVSILSPPPKQNSWIRLWTTVEATG